MRILAVTNLYPNPLQPHRAAFNRQQIRALAAAGNAVRVIAPVSWTDEWSAKRKTKGTMPADRRTTLDGIQVEHPRYVFPPKIGRGWYGRFFQRSVRKAFDRAVAEFQPDVIFASWAYPDGWAVRNLARQVGLPVVLKVHGSDVLLADGPRLRLTADTVSDVDGIVAVSRDLATRCIELGANPDRVRVVYSGVDRNVFYPGDRPEAKARLGLPADVPALVFAGNLVPVKGLDVLIEAFRDLARDQQFVCRLVGQGPLRPQLEQQIEAAGLADRVSFVGPVAQDRLGDWYRAADVFVLPSRSEGVPNVLLEAMACGASFVASRVGGIPEIAHLGNGELFPAGDAKELAAALRRVLATVSPASDNSAEQQRMTRTQADVAAELLAVFTQAVDRHHPNADRTGDRLPTRAAPVGHN